MAGEKFLHGNQSRAVVKIGRNSRFGRGLDNFDQIDKDKKDIWDARKPRDTGRKKGKGQWNLAAEPLPVVEWVESGAKLKIADRTTFPSLPFKNPPKHSAIPSLAFSPSLPAIADEEDDSEEFQYMNAPSLHASPANRCNTTVDSPPYTSSGSGIDGEYFAAALPIREQKAPLTISTESSDNVTAKSLLGVKLENPRLIPGLASFPPPPQLPMAYTSYADWIAALTRPKNMNTLSPPVNLMSAHAPFPRDFDSHNLKERYTIQSQMNAIMRGRRQQR